MPLGEGIRRAWQEVIIRPNGHTTIYGYFRSTEIGGIVTGQEQADAGDLFRLADALDGLTHIIFGEFRYLFVGNIA